MSDPVAQCYLCTGELGSGQDQEHLASHHRVENEEALDLVSNLSKLLEDEISEVAEFIDRILSSRIRKTKEESDESMLTCKLEVDESEDKYVKEEDEASEAAEEPLPAKRAKLDSLSFKGDESDADWEDEERRVKRGGKKGVMIMGKLDKLALQEPVLGESICPGNDCGKVFTVTDYSQLLRNC